MCRVEWISFCCKIMVFEKFVKKMFLVFCVRKFLMNVWGFLVKLFFLVSKVLWVRFMEFIRIYCWFFGKYSVRIFLYFFVRLVMVKWIGFFINWVKLFIIGYGWGFGGRFLGVVGVRKNYYFNERRKMEIMVFKIMLEL